MAVAVVLYDAIAGLGPAGAQIQARRVALVIGNAACKAGPLANPVNDATAVAEALEKQLKFDTVLLRRNGYLLVAVGELALLGDTLERLVDGFDAIEKVAAFRGKQAQDLVLACGETAAQSAGPVVDKLANFELVVRHGYLV
jgi:hypothetical protein